RRSLLWLVPLALVLIVPIAGVIEKATSAFNVVFDPARSLKSWGGDVFGYFPEAQFLGVHDWGLLIVAAPLLAWGAYVALRAAPRRIRLALIALFAFAVVFAIEFRLRRYGYYFHFKTLAFAAPVLLVTAAAGFGRSAAAGWQSWSCSCSQTTRGAARSAGHSTSCRARRFSCARSTLPSHPTGRSEST